MVLALMRVSQAHCSVEIKCCHLSFEYEIKPTGGANSFSLRWN